MCNCIPIVCTCNQIPYEVSTPSGLPTEPKRILCPRCGNIEDTKYFKTKNLCLICFCIPCPCGTSDPYLGCGRCKFNLGGSEVRICPNCKVGHTLSTQYCASCGQSIR